MKNKLFTYLFGLLIITQINAQFLDSASPLQFDGTGTLSKTTSGFSLQGRSIPLIDPIYIQGAALRFNGDASADIWIQYVYSNNEISEKYKAKLFEEPNSNRFIASVLRRSDWPVIEIRYIAESASNLTFLTGGIYDPSDNENTGPNKSTLPMPKISDVEKPKIISRSEWGARNPKYDYSEHPYFDKMTLHHAAGWAAKTLDEGKAAVKSIQEFHQDGRGWSDIGYHFLVDMAGNIYQGRPETVLGAHVGGANTGNIGVCILGCYHPPETSIPCNDEMSYDSEKSLIQLYAWISDTYGVEPKVLKGHRDYFGNTSCPGNNVWAMLPQLRSEIALFILYGFQPTRYALFQNYPNPFNASTTLHYDVPEPSDVKITIYDILGKEIITIVDEFQYYGYKKIIWDGKNRNGKIVPPGVYFYRAHLGDLVETKKMIMLK